MNRKRRLDKVQKALQPARGMLKTPLYLCIVDGEPLELDILEAHLREWLDGQEVEIKGVCGYRYSPQATQAEFEENMRQVQEYVQRISEEYNRDPAAYNARCAAELEEIKRLAPLRREDRRQGKDPDKEHPHTFRISFHERTENA